VPAGLTRYASQAFGDGFQGNFFAAMFNLRKVTRHVVEADGATFKIRDSDFLASDNRDFHPTDVIEDADGSLLVIDTGPWYKLCCPTSQIAKPDILGGIYRIRRSGAAVVTDPRGRTLAWNTMKPAEISALLGDARPAVQAAAVRTLATLGAQAIPALDLVMRTSASVVARQNAVWALTRMDGAPAREATRVALGDRSESVRHAALHSAALWRDAAALPQLTAALKSDVPSLQRAAAEALGRVGDPRAVPDLLAAAASPVDRVLEHSITYALIEINSPGSTRTGASASQAANSRSARAALIALDQMDDGALQSDRVLPLLDSTDPVLKETAWWIAGHRPEWGDALARFFEAHLLGANASRADRDELQQKLAQFGENPAIQELLARTVEGAASKEERVAALTAMAAAAGTRVKVLPSRWIAPLARASESHDDDITARVLAVVRAVPAPKQGTGPLQSALMQVGRDTARPIETRLNALAAIPGGPVALEPDLFELVRTALDPAQPVSVRSAASTVVEKARLDTAQLAALTPALQSAGPLELPRLVRAFGSDGDEAAGTAMIAALAQAKSRSSLRPDILRPVLVKYPAAVQNKGEALLASLTVGSENQAQRLEQLLTGLQGGDVNRGQAVFNSARAACYSCHAIGYMGGRVGPDLTRIGQVRSERDLLEAIVYPSASFARGYEPVTIRTRSGETRAGILRSELPDEVVLATGERDDARIARRDIVDMQPGTVSPMPQGFDQQLSRQELADLLAFLKATRSGAAP
jgi:putative heme-binding domain-containing protein